MKKKRRPMTLRTKRAIAGYLFLAPFIIGFCVFMLKPIVHSLYMSFQYVSISAGAIDYSSVNFDNYLYVFNKDPTYTRLLVESISSVLIHCVSVMVFSFFVAILLNMNIRGRFVARAIFVLPLILSSGILLSTSMEMERVFETKEMEKAHIEDVKDDTSITVELERILRTTGIAPKVLEELFNIINSIYKVVMSSGIQIIIFLSAMQTVPRSMYEAAAIEGSTAWENLWKITFPAVSSLFLVNWIYTIVDYFLRNDNAVIIKINEIIEKPDFGLASAMSWLYFLVVIIFIAISSLIISKGVYYYE